MDNLAGNPQAFPPARACPSIVSRLPERELRTATSTGTPFADAVFREDLDRRLGLAAGRRTDKVAASARARAAAVRSR